MYNIYYRTLKRNRFEESFYMTDQKKCCAIVKKMLIFFSVAILTLAAIVSAIVAKEKITRDKFISQFNKIQTGESTQQLKAVFGTPHIFYGEDVSLIFPESANRKICTYSVYRFSTDGFFIPLVCDFLIENDMVCKKKLLN